MSDKIPYKFDSKYRIIRIEKSQSLNLQNYHFQNFLRKDIWTTNQNFPKKDTLKLGNGKSD